jgi:hypothetical protein
MVSILGSESFVDFVYKMATAHSFHHYQQALEHHSHNTIKEPNPPLLKKIKQSFKMQLTNVFTFIAIAIAGVSALPNGPPGGHPQPPPPPQPPVINHQVVRVYLLLLLNTFETTL